jgi:alkanesulfonate monooxygenase SsuD/methylene tetrahydromethanopterin reductase-like flavin-dependent oxidoreductase (luciferase family)
LDESLAILAGLWSGEPFAFEGAHCRLQEMTLLPRPVQSPRIMVWVVGPWPRPKSMRRALHWGGILPVTMSDDGAPDRADPVEAGLATAERGAFAPQPPEKIAEISAYVRRERGDQPYDIVVEGNSSGSSQGAGGGNRRDLRRRGRHVVDRRGLFMAHPPAAQRRPYAAAYPPGPAAGMIAAVSRPRRRF